MKIKVPTIDLQNINQEVLDEIDRACIDMDFLR